MSTRKVKAVPSMKLRPQNATSFQSCSESSQTSRWEHPRLWNILQYNTPKFHPTSYRAVDFNRFMTRPVPMLIINIREQQAVRRRKTTIETMTARLIPDSSVMTVDIALTY